MIHLLMTRPAEASARFTTRLSPEIRASVSVIHSPLLEIEPLDAALDLRKVRGLIFTSSNGVAVASDLTDSRELPCYCVGRATTEAARREGWTATMAGENAETLTAFLLVARPAAPLLHLRGEHSRGNVAQTLSSGGLVTSERVIYRQKLLPLSSEAASALAGTSPVVLPLFSPRTARQFADMALPNAPLFMVALSDAVREPVEKMVNSKVITASRPDADAMREAVEMLVRQAMRVEGPSRAH
ncbi:uroporphyrinogen-III synthase [Ruegeria marina]|uniref:Uroporphyrinogen-III synthase n=1 Tax=Ruegeria marina TaxID=639004 RepID=A0A1G6WCA5_9RHOB|nr:uroporphyrinogen-III synthase [Ruegeria marina]SDD62676.1 uroporphyrinogen-III synthase [Ruegeria marina]